MILYIKQNPCAYRPSFQMVLTMIDVIIRPRPNIISRLKVLLVKEHTQIKIILIASYFFSGIELATIDIHFSYRTIQSVHRLKAGCDWVIIFGDV